MQQELAELDRQCVVAGQPAGRGVRRGGQAQPRGLAAGRLGAGGCSAAALPRCGTARALAMVEQLATERTGYGDRPSVLVAALSRKNALLQRARRDLRYKALMDVWLHIHVPLSFALLAALIAHIVSVFYYWG